MQPPPFDATNFLRWILDEDIGEGDVTSNAVIPEDATACFVMHARQNMVAAGLVFLPTLWDALDARVSVKLLARDGDSVRAGQALAEMVGPARALLAGERTALNLVQQLSGVATLTAQYVHAVAGTGAVILDTRKTIPGLRVMQKYAVTCGGGVNHRMGLDDAVLIKDNHIAVAGGVKAAVVAARGYLHHENALTRNREERFRPLPRERCGSGAAGGTSPLGEVETRLGVSGEGIITIEVECDMLAQVDEALAAGVDTVLLDNMSNDELRRAVEKVRAHNAAKGQAVKTEASGNVNLETVHGIAQTGVDFISVGKLTHSAVAVDIGLDAA